MKPVVRAIDVGRGNNKFVLTDDGITPKCMHFPSEAYPREFPHQSDGVSGKRKTVSIPIDGLYYEVGPDVHLAADVFNAKILQHDNYYETTEYLALVRGALHYMKVPEIDLLVLGLPVATFKISNHVSALERKMTGQHPLGDGRSVLVKKVKVLAQPIGALMHYGTINNRLGDLRREKSLIIDPGARTFDWVVTSGMQSIDSKSNSINRGMFDVLQKIAEGISQRTRTQYRQYEAIDTALRGNKKLLIFQAEYDITDHLQMARKIPEHAVAEMLHYVGDANDIRNIIVVGGGAFFFKQAIKDAFPRHKIHELKDALYSPVRGFQEAGRIVAVQEAASHAAATATTAES